MRGRFIAVFAFVAGTALVAQSASAAGDPAVTQPAASPIKNDTGKRVCREVTPTGTRMIKRICRSADEWERDADAAQRHMDEADRTMRENGCGIVCPR